MLRDAKDGKIVNNYSAGRVDQITEFLGYPDEQVDKLKESE